MPGGDWSLPRLTALAERWRTEAGLAPEQHEKIARLFQRQLSSSGQFHYSLQPVQRDESIDAIEDFVSNNPSGHCEYFATALALMLRSQGIPSRVMLGYRCDEWDPRDQCFQVRQLHAHAWVEAYLDPAQVLAAFRSRSVAPIRGDGHYGGWLRLDGTPADELGSTAADSTTLGAWEARFHAIQHLLGALHRRHGQQEAAGIRLRAGPPGDERTHRPAFQSEHVAGAVRRRVGRLGPMLRSGIMGKLLGGAA